MKPYLKLLLFGVGMLCIAAAGNIYYEVLPGLQIKHPITGATTATINGTNGTVTAGFFVGNGSGLTGLPSGGAIVGTLVTNGTSITAGDLLMAGSRLTNVVSAGAPIWTNVSGVIKLSNQTNVIDLSTATMGASGKAVIFNALGGTNGQESFRLTITNANDFQYSSAFKFYQLGGPSTNHDWSYGLSMENEVHPGSSLYPLDNGGPYQGQFGAFFAAKNRGSDVEQGVSVGAGFLAHGNSSELYIGGVGYANSQNVSTVSTNVGLLGVGNVYGPQVTPATGAFTALAGIISDLDNDDPIRYENAALLLDTRTWDLPLIVGRTNNGTTVFEVDATGSVSSAGTVSANAVVSTNGATIGGPVTITNASSQVGLAVNGFAGQAANVATFAAGGTNYIVVTNTGATLFIPGSSTAPSISFLGAPTTGFYNNTGNGFVYLYTGGNPAAAFSGTSGTTLYGTSFNLAACNILSTVDGTVQLSANAASPSGSVFKSASGSGTDKFGGTTTVAGGKSTGTGRGGGVVMQTSSTSTTGSSANDYQDRARYVPKFIDLTDNTATTLFTVTLPATNVIGIQFVCTVQASDGTDFQSLTTPVTVDAVAKTTTITTVVAPTAAQTTLAASSASTLSVTYTVVDAGSNVLAVKATADTSFGSPTYLRAKIVMTAINGIGAGWSITEI